MRQRTVTRPETIRVFGRDYAVSFFNPTPLGVEQLGLCDNLTQEISVVNGLPPIEEADTVLHEVIHAIDYLTGLELSEHQVRHLTNGLMGVLQDNPEFARWITENKNVKGNRKRT